MSGKSRKNGNLDRSSSFINRELSFLAFARRVLSLVGRDDLPLLERIKFAGIVGMLHDEFFMKRVSGLKREIEKGSKKRSIDGRLPDEEFAACSGELAQQVRELDGWLRDHLLPAMDRAGLPVLPYAGLALALGHWRSAPPPLSYKKRVVGDFQLTVLFVKDRLGK